MNKLLPLEGKPCEKRMNKSKGFTLIEIMVAVAVLGLAGIVLLSNVNQATRDMSRFNEKLTALSVAEYALNSALIRSDDPELGTKEEVITLADREWLVEITISETPNEKVHRIDTLVKPNEQLLQENTATILLSAFKTDSN